MPDHFHLLAEGIRGSSNLLRFVAHYKQTTGFEFQQRWAQQLWQFKYFDHILRKSDAFESGLVHLVESSPEGLLPRAAGVSA
jgi:hypothetical protein